MDFRGWLDASQSKYQAHVVAVALHGVKVEISEQVASQVEANVPFLESRKHLSLYGVTTGFGGSADT